MQDLSSRFEYENSMVYVLSFHEARRLNSKMISGKTYVDAVLSFVLTSDKNTHFP